MEHNNEVVKLTAILICTETAFPQEIQDYDYLSVSPANPSRLEFGRRSFVSPYVQNMLALGYSYFNNSPAEVNAYNWSHHKPQASALRIQYLFENGMALSHWELLFHHYSQQLEQELLVPSEFILDQMKVYDQVKMSYSKLDLTLIFLAKKYLGESVPWYVCEGFSRERIRKIFKISPPHFTSSKAASKNKVQPVEKTLCPFKVLFHLELVDANRALLASRIVLEDGKSCFALNYNLFLQTKEKQLYFYHQAKTFVKLNEQIFLNSRRLGSDYSYEESVRLNILRDPIKLSGPELIDSTIKEISEYKFELQGLPEKIEINPEQIHTHVFLRAEQEIKIWQEFELQKNSYQNYFFERDFWFLLYGFSEGFWGLLEKEQQRSISWKFSTHELKIAKPFLKDLAFYALFIQSALKKLFEKPELSFEELFEHFKEMSLAYLQSTVQPPKAMEAKKASLKDYCGCLFEAEYWKKIFEEILLVFFSESKSKRVLYHPEACFVLNKNKLVYLDLLQALMNQQIIETKGGCFKKKRIPLLDAFFEKYQSDIFDSIFQKNASLCDLSQRQISQGVFFKNLSKEKLLKACALLKTPNLHLYYEGQALEYLNNDNFKSEFLLQNQKTESNEKKSIQNSSGDLNWFELHPRFFLNGVEISEDKVQQMNQSGVLEWNGKLYFVPEKNIPSLQYLERFWKKLRQGKMMKSFSSLDQSIYPLEKNQTLELLWLRSQGVPIQGGEEWQSICDFYDQLNEERKETEIPATVRGQLKPYQIRGVQWLQDLYLLGLGGILADEMGLGKTLQSLVFLEILRQKNQMAKVLVVVPTSLTYNWSAEAKRFIPDLPQHIFSSKNQEDFQDFLKNNSQGLVICSYGLFVEHLEFFQQFDWNIHLYDEAQNLKNIAAQRTSACRKLKARFKLCLTGTPLENHLGELYSLLDLVVPGALGAYDDFRAIYVNPASIAYEQIEMLKQKIRPLILRRSKTEILKDLPDKVENSVELVFDTKQKKIYRDIALSWNERVRETLEKNGEAQSQIVMLTALLRLRQTCSNPASLPNVKYTQIPPKISTLIESLEEILESGASALVFTQFIATYDRIFEELTAKNLRVFCLNGATTRQKRESQLREFNQDDSPAVMLMTLKTGGVGLNLTKASYVFHIEPWWNPAVENQASDRAHRIGQSKKVQIFRYLMKDSVEEKIEVLKERKRGRFEAMFGLTNAEELNLESEKEMQGKGSRLTQEDFQYLLSESNEQTLH